MEGDDAEAKRRALTACRRCRQRKVKCSGTAPCQNCSKRGHSCIFDAAERRLVVSERHLRDLERRATTSHLPPAGRVDGHVRYPETESSQETIVPRVRAIVHDRSHDTAGGRRTSSGPSHPRLEPPVSPPQQSDRSSDMRSPSPHRLHLSTRGFSQEVRQLLESASSEPSHGSRAGGRASLYMVSLHEMHPDKLPLDTSALNLPPNDYITHLTQVTDYHVNRIGNCSVFDPTLFLEKLARSSLQSPTDVSEVWQVELLLVIALGKLFLEKGATRLGPPGVREFLQATKKLPANIVLHRDPITAIETLCLLTIYAQAVEMYRTAYLYMGEASRIARCYELDRNPTSWHSPADLSPAQQNHARRLWWTVCVLDQRSAAAIGVTPDSMLLEPPAESLFRPDENASNVSSLTLRLNLCLANLLTKATTVHCMHAAESGRTSGLPFNNEIIPIFKALQDLGREIQLVQQLCSGQSLSTMSRPAATLYLLYCHCVILATKPVLMHQFKMLLEQDIRLSPREAHVSALSGAALGVLKSCVNAASLSLNIISTLREQALLETFLSFDLEVAFLAALSLVLANMITPLIADSVLIDTAKVILEEMGQRGNIPAASLKDELEDIRALTSNIVRQSSTHPTPVGGKAINDTVIRDGQVLSNAILDVVEVIPSATVPPAHQSLNRPSEMPPQTQTPIQRHSQLPAPLLNTDPMTFDYLEGIDDGVPNAFTFDTEDLQWLDLV